MLNLTEYGSISGPMDEADRIFGEIVADKRIFERIARQFRKNRPGRGRLPRLSRAGDTADRVFAAAGRQLSADVSAYHKTKFSPDIQELNS